MPTFTADPTVTLSNRVRVPLIGFGTAEMEDNEKKQVAIIRNAVEAGYRHFDSAYIYRSERAVGTAIRESGLPRDDFFLTTKTWNADMRRGPLAILRSFEESLRRFRTDYIDLLYLHWPVQGKLCESWAVLEQLYLTGRVRAIGLSNVQRHHLMAVITQCDVVPHIQQDEFCPWHMCEYVRYFGAQYGIQFSAMMPLRRLRHEPTDGLIGSIAQKHGKTMHQVLMRWNLQHQVVALPKSTKPHRMRQNRDIFDFRLDDEDMRRLDSLNREAGISWDQNNFGF